MNFIEAVNTGKRFKIVGYHKNNYIDTRWLSLCQDGIRAHCEGIGNDYIYPILNQN